MTISKRRRIRTIIYSYEHILVPVISLSLIVWLTFSTCIVNISNLLPLSIIAPRQAMAQVQSGGNDQGYFGGGGDGSDDQCNNNYQTPFGECFKKYENSIYGVSIQYPPDWQLVRTGGGGQSGGGGIGSGFDGNGDGTRSSSSSTNQHQVYTIASFQPNTRDSIFAVLVANFGRSISLQEFSSKVTSNLKTNTGVAVNPFSTNLGSNPAYGVIYTDKKGDKIMQVWTVVGSKAYSNIFIVTPEQFSNYLPIIQKMVDSFQINIPPTSVLSSSSSTTSDNGFDKDGGGRFFANERS